MATAIKLFPEWWNNESQQINNLTTKLKNCLKKKYGGDLPTKYERIDYQKTIYGMKNQVAGIKSRFDYDGVEERTHQRKGNKTYNKQKEKLFGPRLLHLKSNSVQRHFAKNFGRIFHF